MRDIAKPTAPVAAAATVVASDEEITPVDVPIP
jgi:hypothetical protein